MANFNLTIEKRSAKLKSLSIFPLIRYNISPAHDQFPHIATPHNVHLPCFLCMAIAKAI